jgi:hypothetical protein
MSVLSSYSMVTEVAETHGIFIEISPSRVKHSIMECLRFGPNFGCIYWEEK